MAASLVQRAAFGLQISASSFLKPSVCASTILARDASKKAGGSSRNAKGHTKGKHWRLKREDGMFVHNGEIVLTQHGLKTYPGENIGILPNNTLYALCDGKVVVTVEQLSPYPDSPLYERVENGMVIFKKFCHIYPTQLHAKFKLVSK